MTMYSFEQIGRIIGLSPEQAFQSFLEIQEFFFDNFGTVKQAVELCDGLTESEAELLISAATGKSPISLLIAEFN